MDLKALRAAAGARAPADPPPDLEPPIARTPPVFADMLNKLKRRVRDPNDHGQPWPHVEGGKGGRSSVLKQVAVGAGAALSCIVLLAVYRNMAGPPPTASLPAASTVVPPELVAVELKPGQSVLLRGRLEPTAETDAAAGATPAPPTP